MTTTHGTSTNTNTNTTDGTNDGSRTGPGSYDVAVAALVAEQWARHHETLRLPDDVRTALADHQVDEILRRPVAGTEDAFREWHGLSTITRHRHDAPANRARVAWLLGAIASGERVVDIGCGPGAIGGRILVGKAPERYAAIERSEGALASFVETMDGNGVDATAYELHRGSAEHLAGPVLAEVDPTLVLLLEVLEHVRQPEVLLTAVGHALPDGADLLISVPIHGRIETEWGHRSVFDRTRLEHLVAAAGLQVHWVQPMADRWLFLLLARTGGPRPRLTRLAGIDQPVGTDRVVSPADGAPDLTFRSVPLSTESAALAGRRRAAVRIECGPLSVARIRVRNETGPRPWRGRVELLSGDRVVERWTLTRYERLAASPGPFTWLARRGEAHGRRRHTMRDTPAAVTADAMRVTVWGGLRRPIDIRIEAAEAIGPEGPLPTPIVIGDHRSWTERMRVGLGTTARRLRRRLRSTA